MITNHIRRIALPLMLVILGVTMLWLAARLTVEILWFGQFTLQSVLWRRWLFQLIGLIFAAIITFTAFLWQVNWLAMQSDRTCRYRFALQGWRFGSSLLLLTLFALLALTLLTRFAWLACWKPLALTHWWAMPGEGEAAWIPAAVVTAIIPTVALFFSKQLRLLPQLLGSLCFCLAIARGWGLWSLALAIPDSGVRDPLLGADISFALGRFPALVILLELLGLYTLLTLAIALLTTLIRPPSFGNWAFVGLTSRQSSGLRLPLLCLLISGSALLWLSRHQFLWTQSGVVAGAGWLDVHFRLPLRTLAALSLLACALLLLLPTARSLWRTVCLVVSAVSLLGELLLAPLLQWLLVRPRELRLETPYIAHAIRSTRRAFQLDAIRTRAINPRPRLSRADLTAGARTLKNLRLWGDQPLLATNRQLQQLRVYYRFSSAAVDRYRLKQNSGERQQVIVAARELDQASLPARSRTWLNRHFVFTHGYGFTLSPVNTKATDGLPEYFISDLGRSTKIEGNRSLNISRSDVESSVPIGRAALYFGVLPSPYAIAPTNVLEFDFPEGDQNTYNHYAGRAGIPLSKSWQCFAAALYLREPRLLFTDSLNSRSRLLVRREVRQRVRALAPFLNLASEPYLVSIPISKSSNGFDHRQHQYWIIDGYTQSNTYPYAASVERGESLRYLRNSIKAVVDAYNGSVWLFVSEPEDPLIQGWRKLFPELLQPLSHMPRELREHLMVPVYQFNAQVRQLLRYHVTDPRIFYSGDDVWQVPIESYGGQQVPVEPYHITAQLKGSDRSEFLLLQPLTPLARPNLSAWLAARSDGNRYGQLELLRFPSQTPIFGPEQIQALINQNPLISQQYGLWDRAGSQVVQGNLLVVPIGNALLYVEPVYLRARRGGLPTLTRIVVSDGSRVAMAETLLKGLNALVEGRGDDVVMVSDIKQGPITSVIGP